MTTPSRSSAASAQATYEQWSAMGKKRYSTFRFAALFNKGIDLGHPLLNAIFEGRAQPRNDFVNHAARSAAMRERPDCRVCARPHLPVLDG